MQDLNDRLCYNGDARPACLVQERASNMMHDDARIDSNTTDTMIVALRSVQDIHFSMSATANKQNNNQEASALDRGKQHIGR